MASTQPSSIKKLVIRGAIWTIAGYGASQILRLGSNLILTRLLEPELFGLMALVYTFFIGLNMFSDVGINISIIQNKRGDDPDFLNTAWTIQVIRGFVLWGGCWLIAYPVALFYDKPEFLWLLPTVGLSAVLAGFTSTALHTLNRHLAVKQVALLEFLGQLFGTTVMIVWAWLAPSVFALVVGGLASAVFQLAASYYFSGGKLNRFQLDPSAMREILSFGVWIFLSTAMTFLAERGDQIILGKVLGLELFGIYVIAFTFADLPRAVTLALSSKVLMPALSKIADQPRPEMRAKLNSQRKRILFLLAVGLAILAAFGDVLIRVLYDDRYLNATWMLPILAIGIWPRLLCNMNEPALFAIGRPQYTAAANLSRFMFTAVGIWTGYSLLGLPGAVFGVALNDLGYYIAVNFGLRREGLSGIQQDLLATGLMFLLLILLSGIRAALGFGTSIDQLFTMF
ncbi:MAG: oligosaccharide flippase family protein [Elainella sp. Prado103]|jgi:O-antigen/teichoic acid export membrane protein|nr:oligosaccharide flippase family protein [Elainella sp. Prado103]